MRRRGLRSFCHGVASTSTVQQLHGKELVAAAGSSAAGADAASSSFVTVPPSVVGSCVAETEVSGTGDGGGPAAAVTLEQMILQLDLEEEAARKARRTAAAGEGTSTEAEGWCPRRMSCVDGGGGPADHVLRSARDALNQYPRFSLDGRDAMYRASFSGFYEGMGRDRDASDGAGNRQPARASVCCAAGAGCAALACSGGGYEMDLERTLRLPATVAGESVVWCKPGVVAKLMGLEAVPVPLRGGLRRRKASGAACGGVGGGGVRKQRPRRTGQDELALHKEKLFMALHGYDLVETGGRHAGGLRSGVGAPNVVGAMAADGDGWESQLPR